MENPATWNLLTSSLGVSELTQPHAAWAFLVVQGLVADDELQRARFVAIVRAELIRGEITGPSIPWRVADALVAAGIGLPPSLEHDPHGQSATSRLASIAAWSPAALGHARLDDLRRSLAFVQNLATSDAPVRKRWWKRW